MKRISPIIKLTLLLLCGVICGSLLELPLEMTFLSLLVLLTLFLTAYWTSKKLFSEGIFFGMCSYLLFFGMGVLIACLHKPENQPKHFIQQISSENTESTGPLLLAEVTQVLKPDLFSEKAVAEVQHLDHSPAEGKLLLLLPKESSKMSFLEGQQILLQTELQEIPGPKNPHQFNYQSFMARRNVLRQAQLKPGTFQLLPKRKQDMESLAADSRKKIVQKLQRNGFSGDELATVQALLLGQKQDISAEVYNNYAAAGVIHILAVSGLHVGIILLLLNWLFSPLDRFKNGKILKAFFVILLLWAFAVLSGLSPSVVRAVSMFSFLAVGMQLKRRSSNLISVFVSLLFLLLIKPQWVFEVGFQLSYLAVLGILLLQPPLYKLWRPSNKILKVLWGIFTGSIAAQAAVLPLSLLYFHQFPGLFFLSNLVILPLLGILLGFGILVILLALLDLLPQFLSATFGGALHLLNDFVAWASQQEQFLFKDISFSSVEVLAFYLLIIALGFLLYSFSYRRLLMALSAVILLQLWYISKASETKEQLLVFHNSKQTFIGVQKGEYLVLFQETDDYEEPIWLKNFRIGEDLQRIRKKPLKNIYLEHGKLLLVIDSSGIYPQYLRQKPYVLLSGSPKINLERVIKELQPRQIIADGSNYRSYVQRWQNTAKLYEIPFFNTFEKGAFVME
ncbi:MAG: ComEC/Rec2 family competence protein [Salinimicrobium sp.]